MASIPITTAISTVSGLIGIFSFGVRAVQLSNQMATGEGEDINSRKSRLLVARVHMAANALQNIDPDIVTTEVGEAMVVTMIDCINWAILYNNKHKIKKIVKFEKYRYIFDNYHSALDRNIQDLHAIVSLHQYTLDNPNYYRPKSFRNKKTRKVKAEKIVTEKRE